MPSGNAINAELTLDRTNGVFHSTRQNKNDYVLALRDAEALLAAYPPCGTVFTNPAPASCIKKTGVQ